MKRFLSTSEFAQAIGMSESSARRIADDGDVAFHRTRGGHRRVSVAEVIRWVRESETAIARPDLLGLSQATESIDLVHGMDKLREALEEGKANSVLGLLQALYAAGSSISEICDGPIVGAMQAIGARWPSGRRAIFVEHRATVLCVRALCQLRLSIPEPDDDAPLAIGGAPAHDPYLLPSMMVSLILHEAGFNETNLGPNTPIDVLADAVEDEKPAVTWLSINTPVHYHGQIRDIERLVEIATAHDSTVIVGGRHVTDLDALGGQVIQRCANINELKLIATKIIQSRR